MRNFLKLLVACVLLMIALAAHAAEKRIALVIGNGNYQYSDTLPKLDNPPHDAEDIAAALRGFGFEVIEKKNLNKEGMDAVIAEFGRKIANSDAALFYFAGHGLQVRSQNYLIPVDANIESEAQVPYKSINVNQLLDEMDSAHSSANIVMLDACRNNPISGRFRSGATRGLAAPTSQPKGTVIVYATDPGNVASDGDGRNGLFTAGLLTAFKGSDLSLHSVLVRTSKEVERGSEKKQTPYINGPATLQEEFHFRVTVDPGRGEIEKTFWSSIEHSSDPADFEAYLQKYPKGNYRALAENQLKRLKAESRRPTAAPTANSTARPVTLPPAPSADPETQFWDEVKSSGAREYLDAYLKQYPKGKYLALAKVELKKLDERERQEALRAEQQAWEQAKSDNSVAAYAGYLEHHPKGLHAALAQAGFQKAQREAAERNKREQAQARLAEEERQRQQAAAEAQRREEEASEVARLQKEQAEAVQREEAEQWRKAETATTSATVQVYLDRYPSGRHAGEAQVKLVALKKEEAEMKPGKVFKDCPDCPEMVILPAGSFQMSGAGADKKPAHAAVAIAMLVGGAGADEKSVHAVTITKPFAMGKTEVTQGQWRTVMGNNPSKFIDCGDDCPVEQVSWDDVQEFVRRLNQKTGKNYRLPSEAEWEYACYGSSSTEYCGGNDLDAVGWYGNYGQPGGNSGQTTHPVGQKRANGYGLYDMSGNVWEWTEDCWNGSYAGAPTDGSAWTTGQCSVGRVLRGGSWGNDPQLARAAVRGRYVSSIRSNYYGFRLARILP